MKLEKIFHYVGRFIVCDLLAILLIMSGTPHASSSDFQDRYLLTEWVSELLIWSNSGEPRITKWKDDIIFEVLIDNSDEIDLVNFDDVFFENLIQEIDRELEKSTGRSVEFNVAPVFPLPQHASDASVTVFMSTRVNFPEIAAGLGVQEYSDDFVKMVEASAGIAGVAWNRLCFMAAKLDPEGDLTRAYVMIDLEVPSSDSIRCFSQAVLATLGIGRTTDPLAPSIMAPFAKDVRPTVFDYEILSMLYDGSIETGFVSETQESYQTTIQEYVNQTFP